MKRCIVCGNIGNDDSAICNVCGNPYIDLDETSDDDSSSSEVIEKMEAQLRQVWTKVQNDGAAAQTEMAETAEKTARTAEEAAARENTVPGRDGPEETVLSDEDSFSSLGNVSEKISATIKKEDASLNHQEKTHENALPESDEFSEEWFEAVSLDDVQKQVEAALQKKVPASNGGKETFAEKQAAASNAIPQTETARQAEERVRQEEALRQAEERVRQEEALRQAEERVWQEEALRQTDVRASQQAAAGHQTEFSRQTETVRQAETNEVSREEEAIRQEEAAWRAEAARQAEATRQAEEAQQAEIARQAEEMARQTQADVTEQNGGTEAAARRQPRTRRPRGGPQIYGQGDSEGYNGAQGIIRRDVHDGQVEETIPGNNGYIKETVNSQSTASGRQTSLSGNNIAQQGTMRNARQRVGGQSDRTVRSRGAAETSTENNGSNEGGTNAQQRVNANTQTYARGESYPTGGTGNGQRRAYPPDGAGSNQARGGREGQPTGDQAAPAGTRNTAGNRAAAYGTPQGTRPQMPQGNKTSGLARRVSDAAKDAIGSPLLIIIAFFQTLYFASSTEAIFLRQLNYEQFAKLLNLLNLPSQVSGYVSMFQAAMAQLDSGALVLNLLIRVPDLLFCLGLWLLCITVHSARDRMPGVGFLFMQIVVIIKMVVSCVILLAVLVLSVTLVIASWSAGTQNLIIIATVTLVVAILVTMAVIMYYFCYLSTIRVIKNNARDGELCGKVSTYVAVITMIISLTGIVSILSGIVNLEVTGITTGIGRILWMVLFGVWILKYKSTLKEYNENR